MTEVREARLVETFVTLTDSLVADYDVVDVLQTLVDRAVELFDAAAGAIHLPTSRTSCASSRRRASAAASSGCSSSTPVRGRASPP